MIIIFNCYFLSFPQWLHQKNFYILIYVSANVLGMIGFSCYILADTFFIARGIGADALAALNLALPAYSLMNGTGLMIGDRMPAVSPVPL